MICSFFFFKQKTAYEMRISDWSSDVCSSDLAPERRPTGAPVDRRLLADHHRGRLLARRGHRLVAPGPRRAGRPGSGRLPRHDLGHRHAVRLAARPARRCPPWRSEEHTSELQSLMRISYAVFCLKKKKADDKPSSHCHNPPKATK